MSGNTGKRVTILGSTGSIGTQTLETIDALGGYTVTALTADRNVELMEAQARRYAPRAVVMRLEEAAKDLKVRLADTSVKVLSGEEGLIEAATLDADTLVSSIVGTAGLKPTMAAIRAGRQRIALANKETLVCAGDIFTKAIKEEKSELIPVDSEHSAIFQCLMSGKRSQVKRILLTASGGPFRGYTKEQMALVTKADALKHPNWSMGAKITIDSATMMNKGLEVIEAMHLFNMEPDRITVIVHPQSIIHSAVEFCDGAVVAQLGLPDMRIPIQLALTYPDRAPSLAAPLELTKVGALTFMEPDLEAFTCLKLALSVAGRKDAAPAVMNAANEAAVSLFLQDKISFAQIGERVASAVEALGTAPADTLEDVLRADSEARQFVLKQ